MKVNLDDRNLTAFALGELSPEGQARMAEAIAESPEAQSYVAETQQLARVLRAEYEADRLQSLADASGKRPQRRPYAERMEVERRSWSRYQWGTLAAALAMFAVIAAVAITTIQRESGRLSLGVTDNPKPAAQSHDLPADDC